MSWPPDGKVLATGCVNSGPELLPEEREYFWDKRKPTASCIDKTVECQKFRVCVNSLFMDDSNRNAVKVNRCRE